MSKYGLNVKTAFHTSIIPRGERTIKYSLQNWQARHCKIGTGGYRTRDPLPPKRAFFHCATTPPIHANMKDNL